MPLTAEIAIETTVDREDLLAWRQGALGEFHAVLGAQGLQLAGPAAGIYASEIPESAGTNPGLAAEIQRHMDDWRARLYAGVGRLQDSGALRNECDPQTLGLGISPLCRAACCFDRRCDPCCH